MNATPGAAAHCATHTHTKQLKQPQAILATALCTGQARAPGAAEKPCSRIALRRAVNTALAPAFGRPSLCKKHLSSKTVKDSNLRREARISLHTGWDMSGRRPELQPLVSAGAALRASALSRWVSPASSSVELAVALATRRPQANLRLRPASAVSGACRGTWSTGGASPSTRTVKQNRSISLNVSTASSPSP